MDLSICCNLHDLSDMMMMMMMVMMLMMMMIIIIIMMMLQPICGYFWRF